jgi:hypothetical protein
MMAVGARANNLTQAPDALNRQLGMGVFKMGWISKTTMQELDGVQAVLQLLHEPFIFVHAGPSLSFNLHLNCNTVQHAESRESEGQQFDCVVGRIEQPVRAARLLRIRLAITFVMLPLSIACSICHATTSLGAMARVSSRTPSSRRNSLSEDPMSLFPTDLCSSSRHLQQTYRRS